MSVDTGLHDGIRDLWQNHQLLDLTLKVAGQEFRVHKVVLASVSDYFRAMLCGPSQGSKSDVIELQDVSAEQVSRLLDLIYNGDEAVIENDQKEEMLESGIDIQLNTRLQHGLGLLRQDDQLSDFKLKVDGQEFRVHKVVLASVSDCFRCILCECLKDTVRDKVELTGTSMRQVSRVLDLIYTGEYSLIERNPKAMLEGGIYLQTPKIIQVCTEMLTKSLRVRNCLDLLSMFHEFPVDDTAQKIIAFIKANTRKVIDHYRPEDMTLEIIQLAVQNWKNSEWDLFNFLNSWIAADSEKREEYRDDFFSQIRFKLMTPEEISALKATVMYTETKSLWKLFVDKASTYHQLPIHQKVLDMSIQNSARHSKSVFVMDTRPYSASKCPSSRAHILCKPKKGSGMQVWKSCPDVKPPPVADQFPFVEEVNNFLITCSEAQFTTQHWQIFDPRTLTWHKMAPMLRQRDHFAAVYHKKHLYVSGGANCQNTKPHDEYIGTVDEYNFETGTWSMIKTMPVPVIDHAACVLKDAMYISGGRINTPPFQIPRVDCLDLISQKWESKAPMLQLQYRRTSEHKMFTMKIKEKDAIVVVYRGLWMDYYDPETDQWTDCKFNVPELRSPPKIKERSLKTVKDIFQNSSGEVIARGNTLFWLSVGGNLYNDRHGPEYCLCVKWIIPEEKDKTDIVQIRLEDDPMRYEKRSDWFQVIWGMVAFPPQSAVKVE